MDWFIRFILGLPARVEDAAALRKAIPELESSELRLRYRTYFWPLPHLYESNEELLKALRQWVSEVESDGDYFPSARGRCPLNNCPLQANEAGAHGNEENSVFFYLVAAGGPKAKPPKDAFLDLVKRTHPKDDPPKEVILTDPYIYSDISEDGLEGGFSSLVDYLRALGLSANDPFTLCTTPSPKRGTLTAKKNLRRHLKKHYRNIEFKEFD